MMEPGMLGLNERGGSVGGSPVDNFGKVNPPENPRRGRGLEMEAGGMTGQSDDRQELENVAGEDGSYLERAESLLYRRLYGYIMAGNWEAVGQVVGTLKALSII